MHHTAILCEYLTGQLIADNINKQNQKKQIAVRHLTATFAYFLLFKISFNVTKFMCLTMESFTTGCKQT